VAKEESPEFVLLKSLKSLFSFQALRELIGDFLGGLFEKPDPGTEKAELLRRVWLCCSMAVFAALILLIVMFILSPPLFQ